MKDVTLLCHDSIGVGAQGVIEYHKHETYHTIKLFDKIGVIQEPLDIHFQCCAEFLRKEQPEKRQFMIRGVTGMKQVTFDANTHEVSVKDFEADDYDGDLLNDYGDDVDPDYEDLDMTNVSSQIATKEVV